MNRIHQNNNTLHPSLLNLLHKKRIVKNELPFWRNRREIEKKKRRKRERETMMNQK
jgi:hypothetical protein